MKTVVITSFRAEGIPDTIKIASKNEPSKRQIIEKLDELIEYFSLDGPIKESGFNQIKDFKVYNLMFGDKTCMVTVERLDIMEFPK